MNTHDLIRLLQKQLNDFGKQLAALQRLDRLTGTDLTNNYVALTGAQTVGGVKDFTNGIKVANGTTLDTLVASTYTPAISNGTYNVTSSGHYLRVNNWVLLHADVTINSITSAGSGNVQISLPIVAANFNLLQAFWHNVDIPGTPVNVIGLTVSGANYLLITVSQDNGASVNLQHSGLSAGDAINVTGIYQV